MQPILLNALGYRIIAFLALTCLFAANGLAQDPATPTDSENEDVFELPSINVTGSRITRFETEATDLPITRFDADSIEADGFITSGEIFSELVFTGTADFNESEDGPNDARGDVTSVNLRGVGSEFTLTMLDGRRLAPHPLDQTVGFKSSLLVNANIIPAGMIDHIDILRDGASAIYGTDATAGVVNSILERDYSGTQIKARYGWTEQGDFDETLFTFKKGINLNDHRTNISFFYSYFDRPNIASTDRPYSFPIDHRHQIPEEFARDTSAANVSSNGPYTNAIPLDPSGLPVRLELLDATGEDTTLTSSSGSFHTQPTSNSGSLIEHQPQNNASLDNSTKSRGTNFANTERYDFGFFTDLTGSAERQSFFTTFNHRMKEKDITFFGDLGFYTANTRQRRAASVVNSGAEVVVPKDNYWNPFGPIDNPNRISIANGYGADVVFRTGELPIPDEGLDVLITGWRTEDFGGRIVNVDNESILTTFGAKGTIWNDWTWESGIRYNRNKTTDSESGRISKTGLANVLARTGPDALNVFGGPGVNTAENIGPASIVVTRIGTYELGSWDLSFSNAEAATLFGNPIGFSFGTEYRIEEFSDDRDPHIDGTIIFDDSVNGRSDVTGVSFTPDRTNDRDVYGFYAETLVPIFGKENRLPGFHRMELQLAGRHENYNDFGSVTKPKYSLVWYPAKDVLTRVSHAKGFRAPNLSLMSSPIQRSNTGLDDTYREEFDPDNPRNDGTFSISDFRNLDPNLGPETSESKTAGIVARIPNLNLTLSADYWNVKVKDLIGRNSSQDIIDDEADILEGFTFQDFVNDGQEIGDVASRGSSFVERRPVTQAEFELAQDLGHYPVGDIELVQTTIFNQALREVGGWDFGIEWEAPESNLGHFVVEATASQIDQFDEQEFVGDDIEDQVRNGDDGEPEWRLRGSIFWRKGNLSASVSTNYISEVFEEDVDFDDADGNEIDFIVDSFLTYNTKISYRFDEGMLKGSRFSVGVRNIENKDPPLNPDVSRGYYTGLHSNRGRYYYSEIRYDF